jgi:hypothetical protein
MTAKIKHTQNFMDRDDARSAIGHAPAAWCVVGSKDEILFLSKAKHRADIFAEGTSNAVEPLYRKRAPSGD